MRINKILLAMLLALVAIYFGFIVFRQDVLTDYVRPFILPLVLAIYCSNGCDKRTPFFWFLALYAIGEIISIAYYYSEFEILVEDILYYACNTLYILAYIFLTIEVIRNIDLSNIIKRFAVHLLILLALDIYCVILVTEVAISSGQLVSVFDYVVEFIYNVVIMALLTITLINYLHRDTKKAMNLLIGALCIVFSEVMQVAYYYVSELGILFIAYNLLLILAFYFFYIQIGMTPIAQIHTEGKITEAEI